MGYRTPLVMFSVILWASLWQLMRSEIWLICLNSVPGWTTDLPSFETAFAIFQLRFWRICVFSLAASGEFWKWKEDFDVCGVYEWWILVITRISQDCFSWRRLFVGGVYLLSSRFAEGVLSFFRFFFGLVIVGTIFGWNKIKNQLFMLRDVVDCMFSLSDQQIRSFETSPPWDCVIFPSFDRY